MQPRNGRTRRVLVIGELDGYANSLKPVAIERFLRAHGHEVRLIDTYSLSRASGARDSLRRKLPAPRPRKMLLYAVEAAGKLLTARWGFGRRRLSYYVLLANHRVRRSILTSSLRFDEFDLVICETPHDAGVLTVDTTAETLYDCPTPWADELFFEERLTERQHAELRRREKKIFEKVDHLTFHWESYARYARAQYGLTGRNVAVMNFGCTLAAERAQFDSPPRVVYLGSLGSRFIDLPLLARLARLYPHIDVYGGPAPDPQLGLNYLGYTSPDILSRYQLGLITCTDDPLRREGFSAKHLEYLAAGLPVLVPSWRRHLENLRGSVVYTEQTFRSVIGTLSDAKQWQELSDEAYAQAGRLTWDRTLRPLDSLLENTPGPPGDHAR
ncbi:hypothetical protein ABZ896_33210 [Streptomyces sp. NPDC047072]|uniref:hypothetical protein n=1 Tax=Streptomyces sp. NPDC047072 TaxID=3154809 RepID=UPI0033ED66B3